MVRQSKDLFDDSAMTFGEHLEVLRVHLFKAVIGLVLAMGVCLYYGDSIVAFVRAPIDAALVDFSKMKMDRKIQVTDDVGDLEREEWWDSLLKWGGGFWPGSESGPDESAPVPAGPAEPVDERQTALKVEVSTFELLSALHKALPDAYPAPAADAREGALHLTLTAPEFAQFRAVASQSLEPVTFNVQEAFMTYLKVSLIAGLVFASPWVFFQLWQFVAAGLYRHERKFVYLYGTLSLVLFIAGAAFCFFAVFPFVLKFLLHYNFDIGVTPQIRLSEWISFAVTLPLMFGISFQLPLAMRFLTAISVFTVADYRAKRRLSILVIAFLSMVLTPADPISMLLMLFPLLFLYEFGIWLCHFAADPNPFEGEPA